MPINAIEREALALLVFNGSPVDERYASFRCARCGCRGRIVNSFSEIDAFGQLQEGDEITCPICENFWIW